MSRLASVLPKAGCLTLPSTCTPARHPPTTPFPTSDHDAPLEELASTFARFFGCVDLEKSDLVAGVVLTGLLQTHQRRSALEREATRRRGVSGGKKAQVPGPMPTLPPSSHSWDEVQGLVDRYCSSVAPGCPRCQVDQSQSTSKDDALQECMEHADDEQLPPRGVQALGGIPAAPVQDVAEAGGDSDFQGRSGDGSAGGGGSTPSSQASSSEAAAGVLRDWDGPFLRWVTAVAAGCSTYVTPSHWAGEEARAAGVDPDEAARASAGAPQPASQAEVDDAAYWARHAIAAYGSTAYIWTTTRRGGGLLVWRQEAGGGSFPLQHAAALRIWAAGFS